jgi:hypothetical protein
VGFGSGFVPYRDTKQWRKNKTVKRNIEKKYTMKRTKNLEGDIPGRIAMVPRPS